ncbi:glycine receptor subunit alpha-2-like isoform X2 [Lineus longissimus]|uniref:glycine receptor subunit alpha-2-like isoform X2 n=1 Tax=Lineus longissimus TaxID=88925 RepID=UPI00315DDC57
MVILPLGVDNMDYLLVIILGTLVAWVTGYNRTHHDYRPGERFSRSQFLMKLMENYDSRVPPNFDTDEPTIVDCDIFVSSFDSINEASMDYLITIFMRQAWHDHRLAYGHLGLSNDSMITLDARLIDSLWVPDLFFANEKKGHVHHITVPNRLLRLYKDGTVYYSARLSLTLSCPMELQKFPLDVQVCNLQLESFAYTRDKLDFVWKESDDSEPIQFNDRMELPQFKLKKWETTTCTKNYTTGAFPCLLVKFFLKRDIGFYMIQTYVPSVLIVILSWVSFWINVDAVPARISLGVLTILTMTTQSSGARQSLPRVSYIKAIDVWMSTCLLFVFAALLEFAVVNVLSRKEVRRKITTRRKEADGDGTSGEKVPCIRSNKDGVTETEKKEEVFIRDPRGREKARNVDMWSRRLFPGGFFVFNILYWALYLLWDSQYLSL